MYIIRIGPDPATKLSPGSREFAVGSQHAQKAKWNGLVPGARPGINPPPHAGGFSGNAGIPVGS
ncbi:predicted protein [Coccidioides posadasii str. Silveira]|uniref:Predicted protein n=1 Tax=Coccidioides posadasii (strain RMSCC 757 / Silveira) TaxID=443226 RepID=E9DA61_COCPS|nr:predicted protein [Coccidioides posadasii str. Silveira]